MEQLETEQVVRSMNKAVDTVIENEQYFCQLDSAAGDGDMGSSLAKGFRGLRTGWDALRKNDIGVFMIDCSKVILQNGGGASGPICGTAFRQAGRYAKGKEQMSLRELSEFFQAMVEGIQAVGGAKLGDKTLLDALIPAAESLKASASEGEHLPDALKRCVEAAEKGAESTKEITATKGRASYLGNRSIGLCDAGAKAVSVILKEILRQFEWAAGKKGGERG